MAFDVVGNLYVGGTFDHAGSLAAANIARWNGTSWSALGSGLTGTNSVVQALAVNGSDVFAGGSFTSPFTNIARWDGSNWNGIGDINGTVDALLMDGSNLYAGGSFSQAGITTVSNLAVWTGGTGWQELSGGADSVITAIAPRLGGIMLTGNFLNIGSTAARHVAVWNGSVWSPLSQGLNGEAFAAVVAGWLVFFGGDFADVTSDTANHIAIWNNLNHNWYGPGNSVDGPVHTVAISGSDVYIGGQFNSAGGIQAGNIARWNSRIGLWDALGGGVSGFNGSLCAPTVWAVTVNGSRVFVGGNFSAAGGLALVPAHNLGMYDTTTGIWTPGDAEGCSELLCQSVVYALSPDGPGVDFGGHFINACASSCIFVYNVAYWDGSIYRDFNDGQTVGISTGTVYTLLDDCAGVWIAGQFTNPATNLVYFDVNNFHGLGSPQGPYIDALAEDSQYLYAGGLFSNAGGNTGANNIVRIALTPGSDWEPIGGGFDDVVLSLAFSGPDLIAGGKFTKNSTTGLNHIGRWNTTTQTWSPLGSGSDKQVNSIAASAGEIFAGSQFIQMGGKESYYFAMWEIYSVYLPEVMR